MKLAFNTLNSGLANGGGSQTVILCSETLNKLGHRSDVIATSDNFTWFKHKPVISYIPSDLNAIIATACTTVESTLRSNIPVKAWYIRGHENWMYSEEQLVNLYRSGLINIVNSKGLKQKLASYGVDSVVIYPGIDSFWEDRNLRPKNKIRIGCLYQKKPTKRWEDFVKLAKILGNKDYEYVGFGDKMREDGFLTDFKCNPPTNELINFYSSCHIFFLPTILEGLYNIGLEGALCGCLLVGSDAPLNGMIHDYLFDNETGMVYPSGNIQAAAGLIENPNWSLIPEAQKFIVNNIGTREKNMAKLIKYLGEIK